MYNNFEISLVVFMPNITTNHAITYTNSDSVAKRGKTTKRKKKRTPTHTPGPHSGACFASDLGLLAKIINE